MYNVGPEHSHGAEYEKQCEGCSIENGYSCFVYPIWNGHDGIYECPDCGGEIDA